MFAFSVSPLPLLTRTGLSHVCNRTHALATTRFRGGSLRTNPRSPARLAFQQSPQTRTPTCFSDPPDGGGDDNDEDEEDAQLMLSDPNTGRTLAVGVEHTVDHEGKSYILCYPMDDPVMFARMSDSGVLEPVDDDDLAQALYDNAQAVLAEDHVVLNNSAYVMTMDDQSEDLAEQDEDDDDDDENSDADEDSESQHVEVIGEFLHDGEPYFVVRPMDAILVVAEVLADGYHVLEAEELQKISPVIEQFIEDLDMATA